MSKVDELDEMNRGLSRKEWRKYETRRNKYRNVCEAYSVDVELPVEEQVSILLEAANKVQKDIAINKNKIDEELFEAIKETVPDMTKALWNQLVTINNKKGRSIDSEEKKEKLKQKIEEELFVINAKYNFVNTNDFSTDNDYEKAIEGTPDRKPLLKIPNKNEIDFSDEYETNEYADSVLIEATTIKHKITDTLQKEYNNIKDAVNFITEGDFDPKMFKAVVDYSVFTRGFLDKEEGKMEAFTNKIKQTYDTYNRFSLTMFAQYLAERGLELKSIEEVTE